MNVHADRLDFAPPPPDGLGRALVLAMLAHLVLVAALTWGVRWRSATVVTTVEAELWSALPKPAAPKLVEPAPVPVEPAPPPPPPPPQVEPAPKAPEVDIALEQEKKRLEAEKQLAAQKLEQQERERERLAQEKKRADELKLAQEKKRAEELKLAQEKKKREEAEAAKRAAELKAKQDALKAKQAAQKAKEDAARIEALRKDNLQRMAGLAGASGGPQASGSALKSSAPSANYASRVSAIIKPNIVFTENPTANPTALVEVRVAPEGTIVGRKLLKGSGNAAWDEAVLKAVDKTQSLPRDTDGRVPPVLEIEFRRYD